MEKNGLAKTLWRKKHAGKDAGKPFLPMEKARERRTPIQWKESDIPTPEFSGIRALRNLSLDELVPFIDWTPFFHTWELRGRYPSIFQDPVTGSKAQELFDDAVKLLDQIVG